MIECTQKTLIVIYSSTALSWQILLMLVLLCASAFFSGSETALFNLSTRRIKQFQGSKNRFEKIIVKLLRDPRQLLGCLLFSNMIVNVSFYALASILILKTQHRFGVGTAAVTGFIFFAAILILGEVVPKSIAYANSKAISYIAAIPVLILMNLFRPILVFLHVIIITPTLNLILGPQKAQKEITLAEFSNLIEEITKSGLITTAENRLMENVVELGFLKVRHVMRPRVDMIACDVTASADSIKKVMRDNSLTKIPVFAKNIDNIIGEISLRQLLLKPEASSDKLIQEVNFVPEQKSVESLLDFFRTTRTDTAIVVDEFGGIAGDVMLEDIAEELLGPIDIQNKADPIQKIGPVQYRLNGDLAIHEWVQAFGVDIADTKFATLGGLVTALLGKIPEVGDTAYLNNLKFTVESVHRRRIETLTLIFEPLEEK